MSSAGGLVQITYPTITGGGSLCKSIISHWHLLTFAQAVLRMYPLPTHLRHSYSQSPTQNFATRGSPKSRYLALSPGTQSPYLHHCIYLPSNIYMAPTVCQAQPRPWGFNGEQHRGCPLPSRRVINSCSQPSGIKVGRKKQREPRSTLQGDSTRGGFQEEVIFKLKLEGCVAITQQIQVGQGRALQAE